MNIFQFDQNEILTFFAVLIRIGTLVAIVPFFGDRTIPAPVKILLALAISVIIYPVLVASGYLNVQDTEVWASTASGIVAVVAVEAVFGIALGFATRIFFDAIQIGGNLAGTLMGFASASQYDPNQEAQTQVIAQVQYVLAMLLFLTLNGHHLMIQGIVESYRHIGIGKAVFNEHFARKLIQISGEVISIGFQLAAPMAISLFAINVVYGVMAKAMPQLNVLVLSFSVSALMGLFVMFLSMPEFGSAASHIFGNMGNEMVSMIGAMKR